jgi:hypothetical protein
MPGRPTSWILWSSCNRGTIGTQCGDVLSDAPNGGDGRSEPQARQLGSVVFHGVGSTRFRAQIGL